MLIALCLLFIFSLGGLMAAMIQRDFPLAIALMAGLTFLLRFLLKRAVRSPDHV